MIQPLLYGLVLPFILSLGIGLGFALSKGPRFFAHVLLALTYSLCHYLLAGLPDFPPLGSSESLFYLIPIAPLLPLALRFGRFTNLAICLGFFYVCLSLVLLPMLRFQSLMDSQLLIGLMTFAGSIIFLGLSASQTGKDRVHAWLDDLLVSSSFVGLSISLFLNSSALLAQLAGILAVLTLPALLLRPIRTWLPVGVGGDGDPGFPSKVFQPPALVALGISGLLACNAYFLDAPPLEYIGLALPLSTLALLRLK